MLALTALFRGQGSVRWVLLGSVEGCAFPSVGVNLVVCMFWRSGLSVLEPRGQVVYFPSGQKVVSKGESDRKHLPV